jgi:hypothetical protein
VDGYKVGNIFFSYRKTPCLKNSGRELLDKLEHFCYYSLVAQKDAPLILLSGTV